MNTDSVIFSTWSQAIKPPSDLESFEWCNKHVKLPHSARGPEFDITQTPYLKEVMHEITDNKNSEVVVVAPVGSGKTNLLEGLIPWIIAEDPGPLLSVGQTDKEAKTWVETRLDKILEACEPLQALMPKERNKKKTMSIIFPHMPMIIGGANMSTLQSKSMRWVFGDECWIWAAGMIEEARKRLHDRWNGRLTLVSQGSNVGDDFHAAFLATDMRILHWTCEGCGQVHRYEWEHFKYPKGDNATWKIIEENTILVCPNSDCKKEYKDNQTTRRRLSNNAHYIATNPNPQKGRVGFSYPAMAVPWISWGVLAVEWVKAQKAKKNKGLIKPLQQFIQKRLGQFWQDDDVSAEIKMKSSDYKKSSYIDGQLWDGEVYRFMTVDKQKDHYWAIIRAWNPDGSSRLIFEGKVLTWDTLRDISERYKVQPKFVFIDCGYQASEVYDKCALWKWTPLMGSKVESFNHGKGDQRIKKFWSTLQRVSTMNGVAFRVDWSNLNVKDVLTLLRSGLAAKWEIPKDVSEDYLSQINSEVKREVKDKTTGKFIWRYVQTKKHNHLYDCEAMNTLAAMLLGILDTDPPD